MCLAVSAHVVMLFGGVYMKTAKNFVQFLSILGISCLVLGALSACGAGGEEQKGASSERVGSAELSVSSEKDIPVEDWLTWTVTNSITGEDSSSFSFCVVNNSWHDVILKDIKIYVDGKEQDTMEGELTLDNRTQTTAGFYLSDVKVTDKSKVEIKGILCEIGSSTSSSEEGHKVTYKIQ